MRIALYARVSTKKQADHGISLDVQLTEFTRWVAREYPGADTIEYIEKGVSGRKLSRPELDRMLSDLDTLDVVCVYRGDRLSRDVIHRKIISDAIRDTAELVFLTQHFDDSPEGQLTENIDSVLAEYESAKIGFRTQAALRRKAERGELLMLAPYGYRNVEGGWEIVQDEAETVRLIDALYLDHGYGWTRIKNHLNDAGIPAPRGGAWRTNAVESILKRSIYAGVIRHSSSGDVVESDVTLDGFTPIRDRDIWERIETETASRATGKRPGASLFAGTLRCGECGGSMMNNGRRLYVCQRRKTLGADACVWNTVSERNLLKVVKADIASLAGVDVTVHRERDDRDKLERERDELFSRRRRLLDLVERGHIDVEEAGRRLDSIAARRDIVETMIKDDSELSYRLSEADAAVFTDLDDTDELRVWLRGNVEEIVWIRSSDKLIVRLKLLR
jgi:site-specific DNA recombinase